MKRIALMFGFSLALALAPALAFADGSQSYTSPGTYTFTVPSYGTLTVTVNGAGGGGSSGGDANYNSPGADGGDSSFNGNVAGYGGSGASIGQGNPEGGTDSSGGGTTEVSYAGTPGGASGGDTNTTGGGGSGGAGESDPNFPGAAGGNGGQAVLTYSAGTLSAGPVTVIVGSGGAGGVSAAGEYDPACSCGGNGYPGQDGSVNISWTSPAVPTCSISISPNPSAYASSGTPVTVSWSSSNASQVYVNNIGWVDTSGSTQVASQSSTDYSCYGYSSTSGTGPWNTYSLIVSPVAALSVASSTVVVGSAANFTYTVNGNIATTTAFSINGGPQLVSVSTSTDLMLNGDTFELFASSSLPTTYLTPVGSDYILDTNGSSGPTLKYQGSPVTQGEFSPYFLVAAVQVSNGYQIAWYNLTSNDYTAWSTDSSGNYIANLVGGVSLSTFEGDEPQFDTYINDALKYPTGPLIDEEIPSWEPLAALTSGSGYQILWYEPSANEYTVWNTDGSGNYTSNAMGAVSLATVQSSEPQFDAYEQNAFPIPDLPVGSYTVTMSTGNAGQFNTSNTASVSVVNALPPTCTLSASPSSITQGQDTTLSWSCSSGTPTSCTGTNFSTGGATSGSAQASPSQTTTYTGSCTGPGGTSNFNSGSGEQVTVSCEESWSCSGNTIVQTNTNCSTTNLTTCQAPEFCQSGSEECLAPAISFNSSDTYTGNLQVIPDIVQSGQTIQVHWNVSNAQSCTVQGTNGDSWSGLSSPTGGETSKPITTQTTYTLSCEAYANNPNVTETQTVNVTPVYNEE